MSRSSDPGAHAQPGGSPRSAGDRRPRRGRIHYRDHGYVDGIRTTEGASRIRAFTELGNVPMAEAFIRAGCLAYEHQIDMTCP